MSITYDLGPLAGGRFHQFANAAGQVYYCDSIAQTTTYAIPEGFEDGPDVRDYPFPDCLYEPKLNFIMLIDN